MKTILPVLCAILITCVPAAAQNAVRYNNATGAVTDPIKLPSTKAVVADSALAALASPGAAIYHTGSAWALSRADAAATARVDAVVESVTGTNVVLVYSGQITLTGLTPGAPYYLSAATAGAVTTSAPAAPGTYRTPVFTAVSATSGLVKLSPDLASNNLISSADVDASIATDADLALLGASSLPVGTAVELPTGTTPPATFLAADGTNGTTAFTAKTGYVAYQQGGGQVATPTFNPVAGTYGAAQNVTPSSATAGASLYYTFGASPADPTTSDTLVSGAINVSATGTLKVRGYKTLYAPSAVASAAYTISAGGSPDFYALGEGNTATVNITLAAPLTNGAIVVASYSIITSGPNLSATFDSSAMTEVHTGLGTSGRTGQTFILPVGNLAAGTYSVAFTGAASAHSVVVAAYNNVNQATPNGTPLTAVRSFNGPSNTLSPVSAAGDLVVNIGYNPSQLVSSLGAGQTQRAEHVHPTVNMNVHLSDLAGLAGTTDATITYAADGTYGQAAFALKKL